MMMKHLMMILPALALVFAAACATQSGVTANGDGSYTVTASSYSTSHAYKAAVSAAQDYCHKLGKRVVTKDGKGAFVISDSEAAATERDPAATSFEKDRHPFTSKPAETPKVTLDFKCV